MPALPRSTLPAGQSMRPHRARAWRVGQAENPGQARSASPGVSEASFKRRAQSPPAAHEAPAVSSCNRNLLCSRTSPVSRPSSRYITVIRFLRRQRQWQPGRAAPELRQGEACRLGRQLRIPKPLAAGFAHKPDDITSAEALNRATLWFLLRSVGGAELC